jgi:hypothetical protein
VKDAMKQPMLCSVFFILFSLCSGVLSSSAAEYGVGFNLALDYGLVKLCLAAVASTNDISSCSTASIWYANGTTVDIVKLEGGPVYKQIMRTANARTHTPSSSDETTRGLLGYMFLQNYLSSWTTKGSVDPDAEAITWMFKGLKASTEAHMEESLTAVSIGYPFQIRSGYPFRTAIESLGLNYKNTRTAAIAITDLYGLEGQCDPDPYKTPDQKEKPDDPTKTYLALDYSRSGISAFLVRDDCGVAEVLREYHNTTLAANVDFTGKRADLSHTLRNMIRSTDERDSVAVSHKHPVEISELVMLGESTEDVMLHKVLSDVFGSNYTDLKAGSEERAKLHHPLFAGSRAVALCCQKQLELESTHEWDEGFQGWLLKDIPGVDQK